MLGFCYMQVCAEKDCTDQELLDHANIHNPSGTSQGWGEVAREDCEESRMRPVQCEEYEDRFHFILIC